jgi:hypothetical protein
MSKEEKKLKKRKVREKLAKNKVLTRRLELREKKKKEYEEELHAKRIEKLQRKLDSVDQFFPVEALAQVSEENIKQLEKNVEILKNLETEYQSEMDVKNKINEELEEKGYLTLEDKINFLQKSVVEEKIPKDN